MNELTDRAFIPFLGFISSFAISWDAFASFMASLIIAFLGGFAAYLGKELARKLVERRKSKKIG